MLSNFLSFILFPYLVSDWNYLQEESINPNTIPACREDGYTICSSNSRTGNSRWYSHVKKYSYTGRGKWSLELESVEQFRMGLSEGPPYDQYRQDVIWQQYEIYYWWKLICESASTTRHTGSLCVSIHTHITCTTYTFLFQLYGVIKFYLTWLDQPNCSKQHMINVVFKIMSLHWTQHDCEHAFINYFQATIDNNIIKLSNLVCPFSWVNGASF